MQKYTLASMDQLAQERGGRCLSEAYQGVHAKLTWQCKEGHVWCSRPYNLIYNGCWCPQCGVKKIGRMRRGTSKYTDEFIQAIVKSRDGICLSQIYYENKRPIIQVKCDQGHQWEVSIFSLVKGHWCRSCSSLLSERKCRYILESLTGKKFPSKRIGKMEFDGFCEEIKLSFEYQGIQHYEEIRLFSRSLSEQQQADHRKEVYCTKKSIKLMKIPYTVNLDDAALTSFIQTQLAKFNVPQIQNDVNMSLFYTECSELKQLANIARSRGGQCLSNVYLGARKKLEWVCANGHKWSTTPEVINRGSWCPTCKKKLISESLKRYYRKRGTSQCKNKPITDPSPDIGRTEGNNTFFDAP